MNNSVLAWLLEHGGPVIRYRTARELLDDPGMVDIDQLSQDVIHSPITRTWLERLGTSKELIHLHSSQPTAYENAMGKLVQLGCYNGMVPFDQKTKPFRQWLEAHTVSSAFEWTPFKRMIVGSFLIAAGYHQEAALQDTIEGRLEILWRFTRQMDFEIYTDRDRYPDIPKGFRDKPLVRTELYAGGEEQFPTIYDMHALANYPTHLLNQDTQKRIDAVVAYVLHPAYQAFQEGYGLMRAGRGRYYAIGWSVHLPGYQKDSVKRFDDPRFIQRLALMSHFPRAREHAWFQDAMEHLEGYRTAQGTYLFPRTYLHERPSGYWVTGAYMGLGENRRKKLALALESTFWMLKIKKQSQKLVKDS